MRLAPRFFVLGLVVALIAAVGMIGCSDDDKTTSSNLGSLDDPEFVIIQEQLESFVDSTVDFLDNGLQTLQGIQDNDGTILPLQYTSLPGGGNVNRIEYQNGWHIVEITGQQTNSTTSLLDSVRFIRNGQAQEDPNGLESLVYKHRWGWQAVDTTIAHSTFDGHAELTFSGLNTNQALVSGGNDIVIHVKDISGGTTMWYDFDMQADVANLAMFNSSNSGWSECPTGGTITLAVSASVKHGTATAVTANWTATLTFNNGVMTANVSDGSTNWRYTETICVVPQ